MDATIHTDGAARGNPGPAAAAYVIDIPGRPPVEHAESIGTATNNVAEYTALILGLERAGALGLRRVSVASDSELMVKQFHGEYNVKNAELRNLLDAAKDAARRLEAVEIRHVRRAENRRADQLCNALLDGKYRPGEGPTETPSPRRTAATLRRPGRASAPPADVRDRAIACLHSALAAASATTAPTAEQVWEQLWSVLQEGNVLKTRRTKG